MKETLGIVLVLIGWMLSFAAEAQETAVDTERFRPATARDGGVLLEGVSPGEAWEVDGVLWLHASGAPVVLTLDGAPIDPVVKGRFGGYLGAGFNIGRRFRLALGLPVTLYQSGADPITGAALAVGGVGDVRLTPHGMILDPERRWLGIALSAPISFPTGREDALLGESGPTIEPQVHLEKRLVFLEKHRWLRFSVGLETGWRVRPRTQLLNLDSGGEFTLAVGGRWEPSDRFAIGTEFAAALGEGRNAKSGEWVSWARLTLDRNRRVDLTGGATVGFGQGVGTPAARLCVGVRVRLDPRPRAALVEAAADPEFAVATLRDPGPQPPVPGEAASAWGLRLVGRSARIDARVLFEFDSSRLTPPGMELLSQIAGWLQRHGTTGSVQVAGHCDARGSAAYNDALSSRRAAAVVDVLVGYGVRRERLSMHGYGESRPIGRDHDGNRRVEFVFVDQGR
jgi:outer membrane protein OmpA-like peptidoglycan-associated protein